jgi:hypothetical protein
MMTQDDVARDKAEIVELFARYALAIDSTPLAHSGGFWRGAISAASWP